MSGGRAAMLVREATENFAETAEEPQKAQDKQKDWFGVQPSVKVMANYPADRDGTYKNEWEFRSQRDLLGESLSLLQGGRQFGVARFVIVRGHSEQDV